MNGRRKIGIVVLSKVALRHLDGISPEMMAICKRVNMLEIWMGRWKLSMVSVELGQEPLGGSS